MSVRNTNNTYKQTDETTKTNNHIRSYVCITHDDVRNHIGTYVNAQISKPSFNKYNKQINKHVRTYVNNLTKQGLRKCVGGRV